MMSGGGPYQYSEQDFHGVERQTLGRQRRGDASAQILKPAGTARRARTPRIRPTVDETLKVIEPLCRLRSALTAQVLPFQRLSVGVLVPTPAPAYSVHESLKPSRGWRITGVHRQFFR